MKILSAFLLKAWIITDLGWISRCCEEFELDEKPYGFKCNSYSFEGQSIYQTSGFKEQCALKKECQKWVDNLNILWKLCAKGIFTEDIRSADIVLMGDHEDVIKGHTCHTWAQLLNVLWCKCGGPVLK